MEQGTRSVTLGDRATSTWEPLLPVVGSHRREASRLTEEIKPNIRRSSVVVIPEPLLFALPFQIHLRMAAVRTTIGRIRLQAARRA
jgi:hypothetical protein